MLADLGLRTFNPNSDYEENRADRLDGTEAGRRVRQTTRPRLQHGLPRLEPPRSGCTCARARRLVGDCEPAKPEQPPHPWAPGSRLQVGCYVCGDASHVASGCSMRYKKKNDTAPGAVAGPTRDVNVCSRASVCYR
ncbi:uncharacterized protein LOC114243854 [Bombyx mandarina]|uniref:Uncharacterized protein LOC114243854 n=1 Tax=Bombyx mandarina TaxID=7092 RepID=A0A6J2JP04_BOMMA|nr:uncharacterized protein LOC114243854 [Bombyx mandarina]